MTNAVTLASIANSGYLRNRIINGAALIDQRRAGASASSAASSGYTYVCDRFRVYNGLASGAMTVQQSTTAPSGFKNSCYMTTTTAQSSLGAGELASFEQGIEGFNIADFGWGTASAKPITLSFWVNASVTGNYDIALRNNFSLTNRAYVTTFNVASSNTWEYKTITIAGDTSGSWSTDNSAGLYVIFNLATGSSYITSTTNAWQTGNVFATSGGTRLLSTNGATFYIAGVQVEVGTQATPFEWRPYGAEFLLCQRYYSVTKGNAYISASSVNMSVPVPFFATMRTAPTTSLSGGSTNNLNLEAVESITSNGARYTIGVNAGGGYGLDRTLTLNAEL